ncbi:MAG TPA: hypothetical protein VGV39_01040 [Mesorhizobium sp.]|jgi:hypothetical protein|uniref:hypothetical protein n=1 Tax=Mesorhizobium sp. TaxID=1871066 RepID=UPI002DDD94A2|nr:hypothetical protein [Mesorhizobium sp.]HEV2501627.1 hypothetical protein [Mesorhizobium sp.]
MMVRRSVQEKSLPLLVWNEQLEIDRLQAQRSELRARIAVLRPHSHKRLELEFRLRMVTARQLELQAAIERGLA